jgi:PAS domain S-box-containing protein
MKNRDSGPIQSVSSAIKEQTLRQRAETIAREKENHSLAAVDAMPLEETRQKLHELLVHQIELEMQNDELRCAQTELEDTRARYVDLYDLAPVGYCSISEKGLILEANLTAARLLGMVRGALINQPITRFICFEDQDAYYLHKRQLFATGKPQNCELQMTKRGGETFWAHMTAITLPNADGMPICRVALSDITDRKLKDEELKAIKDSLYAEIEALNDLHAIGTQFIRQNNLQSIFEEILKASIALSHADKGIIQISDEQGRLKVFVQTGFGKPFLELLVNGLESYGAGKAVQEKKRVIAESVLHSPVFIGTPVLQAMLDERIESAQFTPMISGAGNILGVISTYYKTRHPFNERELRMFDLLARQGADVLERTRIEEALMQSEQHALKLVEELRKADQNKNDFISMLSHELRNPLAAIMVGVSLLDLDVETEKSRGIKEIMKRQSAHLCRLVDDLLDLTRINMNKVKLKKERVELRTLAKAVAEDFAEQFKEKGVRLETSIASGSLYLEADPARLTQIIGNLLHNAAKFTETGGATLLTVTKQENQAVICVEDNGIGIQPEILPDLFHPFVQLDNSLDRSNGGLGLGLSIAKGMAELHGGSVSAFSEGLGKGACFTVHLPLSAEEDEQGEKHPGERLSRSFRILCIEDNRDFADLLCSMLEQYGHKTAFALNGIDGIAKAKEFSPDIIFCDIGLPGMNGYEVAKCIRSDNSLAGVFMIALTGYAGPKDIELAMNSGFHKHMPKPIDMAALNRILAEVALNQDIHG